MSWCLTLLLVLHWAPETEEAQESRTVAVGSSVLLNALPTSKHTVIDHLLWEYVKSFETRNIVDYYKSGKKPVIYTPYQGRVIINESTGSLLLKNVQETDSGIYRATINLNKIEARETKLLVLEPVYEAHLQINSTVIGSSVELSCKVPAGRVQAIDWKKDGKPLPRNKCYNFSEDFTVLYIPEAQKSDCGSFSCNASNEISWRETSVNLTIEGIVPALKNTLKISTIALAIAISLAAGSGLGFAILCCQSENKKIKGELWRWLVVVIHGLVCVSSILMFAAALLWVWEEGLSTALTLCMVFLTWVIMVTLLISAVLATCPQHFEKFKEKTVYRVLLDIAAPGGMILVVLFAIFLTENIQHLQRKGCSPVFGSTDAILIVAAISLLILLALFMWYHCRKKSQEHNPQEDEPATTVRMKYLRKLFNWTFKISALGLASVTRSKSSLNSSRTSLSFQNFQTLYHVLCKYRVTCLTVSHVTEKLRLCGSIHNTVIELIPPSWLQPAVFASNAIGFFMTCCSGVSRMLHLIRITLHPGLQCL